MYKKNTSVDQLLFLNPVILQEDRKVLSNIDTAQAFYECDWHSHIMVGVIKRANSTGTRLTTLQDLEKKKKNKNIFVNKMTQ